MQARASMRFRQARGDKGRDKSPRRDDSPPHFPSSASPCLAVVHFEDDSPEHSLSPPPIAAPEERRRSPQASQRLGENIAQRIHARTSGRIRNLQVLCVDGQVTIRGQCATFYTKQLAQHAAMGVIEDETVTNEITVGLNR